MKYLIFLCFPVLFACSLGSHVEQYSLKLPEIGNLAEQVWGPITWKLDIISAEGRRQEIIDGGGEHIIVIAASTSTVFFARPHSAGAVQGPSLSLPAGGIYPSSLQGGKIVLDWPGGILAQLFVEMTAREHKDGRRAKDFNWPRFHSLLEEGIGDNSLPEDLWAVDWGLFAQKTLDSGFDRRRIKAEAKTWSLNIGAAGDAGPWLSDSPFLRKLQEYNPCPGDLIGYGEGTRFWISPSQRLTGSAKGHILRER